VLINVVDDKDPSFFVVFDRIFGFGVVFALDGGVFVGGCGELVVVVVVVVLVVEGIDAVNGVGCGAHALSLSLQLQTGSKQLISAKQFRSPIKS